MREKRNMTDEEIIALAQYYPDRIVVPCSGYNFNYLDMLFAERWLRRTLRIDNVDFVTNKRYVGDGPSIMTTFLVGHRKEKETDEKRTSSS